MPVWTKSPFLSKFFFNLFCKLVFKYVFCLVLLVFISVVYVVKIIFLVVKKHEGTLDC